MIRVVSFNVMARYHFLPRQRHGVKKIVLQTEELKQTGGGRAQEEEE